MPDAALAEDAADDGDDVVARHPGGLVEHGEPDGLDRSRLGRCEPSQRVVDDGPVDDAGVDREGEPGRPLEAHLARDLGAAARARCSSSTSAAASLSDDR